jgi:hypothetical protein
LVIYKIIKKRPKNTKNKMRETEDVNSGGGGIKSAYQIDNYFESI